jgi:hypothetical protein
MSTILGQTGDWGVLASGVLTALIEITSQTIYTTKKRLICLNSSPIHKKLNFYIKFLNNLKIGILYGFFVEAFKLGS